MPAWITLLGVISKIILALLALLSVLSIAIMLDRKKAFVEFKKPGAFDEAKKIIDTRNWETLRTWAQSQNTVLGQALLAATSIHLNKTDSATAVEHAIRSYVAEKKPSIEKGLTVLASLGSNAPFIGLFGTVLGIIQAFGALASARDTGLNLVLFGIAEALVATAVGLFVAIPAVVAYNTFVQKQKEILTEVESIKEYLLSRVMSSGS